MRWNDLISAPSDQLLAAEDSAGGGGNPECVKVFDHSPVLDVPAPESGVQCQR